MNIYDKTKKLYEAQINDLFQKSEKTEEDLLLKILCIALYDNTQNEEWMKVYKIFGIEKSIKLSKLFGGRTIKIPKYDDLENAILLSYVYYEKEILKKSWSDIVKDTPFDINQKGFGRRLANFKNFMKEIIYDMIKDYNLGDRINGKKRK